ncbi:MAG: EAL domain-containing protein [Actinomycetia bacterium]|nr:EAL domain-containing protein [Actinomycetes bacterium]
MKARAPWARAARLAGRIEEALRDDGPRADSLAAALAVIGDDLAVRRVELRLPGQPPVATAPETPEDEVLASAPVMTSADCGQLVVSASEPLLSMAQRAELDSMLKLAASQLAVALHEQGRAHSRLAAASAEHVLLRDLATEMAHLRADRSTAGVVKLLGRLVEHFTAHSAVYIQLDADQGPVVRAQAGSVDPALLSDVEPLVERIRAGGTQAFEASAGRLTVGVWATLDLTGLIVLGADINRGWAADETETLTSVAALAEGLMARLDAEELLGESFEASPVGVTMRDKTGRLLTCNRAYANFIGYEVEEIIGDEQLRIVDPEIVGWLKAHSFKGTDAGDRLDEVAYQHRDGSIVWARMRMSTFVSQQGRGRILLTYVEDITESRHREAELAHRRDHDMLTGLANRTLLTRDLDRILTETGSAGVIALDLDRFSVTNNSLGASAADHILVVVAQRLSGVTRTDNLVARMGGDEFAVVIPNPADDKLTVLASRLLEAIAQPIHLDGQSVQITASAGIAVNTPGLETEAVVQAAEAASSRARSQGGNRWAAFDEDMTEDLLTKARTETELRRAVERHEFVVFYQPEIDMETGRVLGAEALVRWQHPDRGLLSPGAFIDMAEETGLVTPMGEQVLRTACAAAAGWPSSDHDYTLRVNLSAHQLGEVEIVETVALALGESKLPPEQLCLEITETAAMTDPEATLDILHRLRRLGVRLAIDDFGTGFSSLAYLQRFPVDILKIDKSFIDGLGHGHGHDSRVLVDSVIGLGRNLGLELVAEGVETEIQKQELLELGVIRAQGYLFARPMTIDDLRARLTEDAGAAPESMLSSRR